MSYSASDDYCETAKRWQAVPSADEAKTLLAFRGKDSSDSAVQGYREGTKYSCDDSYQMGTVTDDHIFVSTTDNQHQQILQGEAPSADGGVSGYFTDQATVDDCTHSDTLDNGQLNRELQIAPFQASANVEPSYKPHTDCFKINPDKLEENYGTRDFNAALAKCDANNQFGEGGGNQGFNPNLSEMMSNGCLEHNPSKSFSDSSISKLNPEMQNEGILTNSTVSQNAYDGMMQDARDRASDCVKNNTEHPSQEVIDATGYDHNPNPVQGMTGNGIPVAPNNQNQQNGQNNQSQNNADKNTQEPAQAKSSKGQNLPNNGQTQGNQNQSREHDSGRSSGMPTTAANTGQTDSELGKQNSSDGMSIKAFGQGKNSGQSSSDGMSTMAAGQSGSTPSNLFNQSHRAGQSM